MVDKKKVAAGIGIAGFITTAVVLATRAEAAPPPPPPGYATLYGKVTDVETGEAISDVLVSLNGIEVYTNGNGNYAFEDLLPGTYTLVFSKAGYEITTY